MRVTLNPKGGFDLAIPMMLLAHLDDSILCWNPLDDKTARHTFWFTSVPNLQVGIKPLKLKVFKTLQITSWQMALQQALVAQNKFGCTWVAVDPPGEDFQSIPIEDFIAELRKRIPSSDRGMSGVN
jgi:hypothetical protein